jgi:hypothetical protein
MYDTDDDIRLRVEAALYQRVAQLYHAGAVPGSISQRLKAIRVPLDDVSDTGMLPRVRSVPG